MHLNQTVGLARAYGSDGHALQSHDSCRAGKSYWHCCRQWQCLQGRLRVTSRCGTKAPDVEPKFKIVQLLNQDWSQRMVWDCRLVKASLGLDWGHRWEQGNDIWHGRWWSLGLGFCPVLQCWLALQWVGEMGRAQAWRWLLCWRSELQPQRAEIGWMGLAEYFLCEETTSWTCRN